MDRRASGWMDGQMDRRIDRLLTDRSILNRWGRVDLRTF